MLVKYSNRFEHHRRVLFWKKTNSLFTQSSLDVILGNLFTGFIHDDCFLCLDNAMNAQLTA
jgi:hypothetical protein